MITWNNGEKAGVIEFTGAVLAWPVYHNGEARGDYETQYASVWSPACGVVDVCVGTVSYGSAWINANVVVDATPEAKAAAAYWEQDQSHKRNVRCTAVNRIQSLSHIAVGGTVEAVAGRKMKKGERGIGPSRLSGKWARSS